jgi:hypothetical protein
MFRLIFIILISVASSAGGIWGGLYFAKTASLQSGDIAKIPAKREFLTPELFVVPVLTRNGLQGFVVCRLAFAINATEPPFSGISEDVLMNDMFYELVFKGHTYIPNTTEVPILSDVADAMVTKLNMLAKNKRYTEVYIQQVDFFDRDQIRRKAVEDRLTSSG